MTAISGAPARVEIGSVATRTLGAIGRNWINFGALALVFSALPQFLFQWQLLQIRGGATGAWGLSFLAVLLVLVATFLLQGALTYGAVADLNGRRPSIAECLSNGLGAVVPLLGLSIVMGLALICGFLLLIVPGVLMALAWIVAVPSLVVERKGVFGSLSRSADLTRNHRGSIFLIGVVFWVLSVIVGVVVGVVVGLVFGLGVGALGFANTPALQIVQAVVAALANAAEAMVGAVGVAAIYYELRSIKEGIGPQALASVFD